LASGAAATCNWLANAVVSQTFLSLTLKLGGDGTFWLYAGIAAAGMVWVYFALPETNGEQPGTYKGMDVKRGHASSDCIGS
jgi:hypothetical protein